MRPRELRVRGFRSYADEASFVWDGRGLVGVVGPIGSGKTSILDAISFALYGRTSRIEKGQKALINQRRDALQVEMVFDVDGETFKAVRTLRRGGASAHVLYRIENDAAIEVTDKAREMTQQVESLLGLDFDGFRRSVLLAQNQFAEFLEATPTDRDKVLKGVFGFDRLDSMRAIAKERLDAERSRLAVLSERRASAEADRSDLEAKRVELKTVEERAVTLEELRTPFEEVKERIGDAAARRAEGDKRLDRLTGLADQIPAADEAGLLFESAASAATALAGAQEALDEAVTAKEAAAAGLSDVLEPAGGKSGLAAAGDLVAAWRAVRDRALDAEEAVAASAKSAEDERTRVAEVAESLGKAEEVAEASEVLEGEAVQALGWARTALEAAHQNHRTHALRADLAVGVPCPVCAQEVAVLPPVDAIPAIAEAESAVVAAQEALESAAGAARTSSEEVTRIRTRLDGAERSAVAATAAFEAAETRLEEVTAELGATADAAAERLGSGDPGEALETLRSRATAAEATLDAAVSAEEAGRHKVEQARAAADGSNAALDRLREDLAKLAGLLEVATDVGEDSQRALQLLQKHWDDERTDATAAVAAADEEKKAGRGALSDLLEAAGLGDNDDVVEVIGAALAERTAKEAEVQFLEKRLADLGRLAGDEAELVASAELLETVHGDLADSKFLKFVLDERRRVLGDLASEHLEVLTAGRYRFDLEGDFQLVDLTAADAVRAPSSLSGGETFLASLALALALAEIVAREGGRLDAFFLDEGFGSLDPEHLDLAMNGIERLVTRGPERLVVVVSHVPALKERIEDLVVLDRDPITADTRIVKGAAPP